MMHANVIGIFSPIRNNLIFRATKKQKSEDASETLHMYCGMYRFKKKDIFECFQIIGIVMFISGSIAIALEFIDDDAETGLFGLILGMSIW